MNRFQVGDTVGSTKLRNAFDDRCAVEVLRSYLELQDGKARQYKIKKELPTPDEYKTLKRQHFTTNVGNLISDAFSEIESLQSEMDEWYNNSSEGLQQSDRLQRVEEAANTLSDYTSEPDVSETLSAIEVVYIPSAKITSRADRCYEAAAMLRTASEAISGFKEERGNEVIMVEEEEFDWSEADELIDQLDTTVDAIESVEFPGMYD